MKRLLIPLVLLVAACGVHAQSLTPTVVASGGAFASNATHSLSYTVGELAVTTLSNANNFLTQGFQQPDDKDVGITQLEFQNLQVKLYPNPASETVNLWIKCDNNACEHLRVSIHDLLGRELNVPGEVGQNGNERLYAFNLKSLAASMYFVRLFDETTSNARIIKFNKTSL